MSLTREFLKESSKAAPWARSAEQADEYKAAEKAFNEYALENWRDPAFHRQVAADFETVLDYGFRFENPFVGYIDTENVGEFDRPFIRRRRGLKVFETARGGEVNESQMTNDVYEFSRSRLGWHFSEMEDKIRANFGESLAELARLGSMRLSVEVNRRILAMTQAAVPSTSPYYIASSGLTAAELKQGWRNVVDAWRPDNVDPMPVTMIGRAAMIDKVTDLATAGFQPTASEEARQTGFVGRYKGANVVVLKNFTDEDGNSIMKANELWILGGRAGKWVNYGGVQTKQWVENRVDYFHTRSTVEVGGVITDPQLLCRVVDASVAP